MFHLFLLVGLSVGCSVLEKHPNKKVVILERGVIPTGASTKNAGFICSNSKYYFIVSFYQYLCSYNLKGLSEFVLDIKSMDE